jgi:hypothetical protein
VWAPLPLQHGGDAQRGKCRRGRLSPQRLLMRQLAAAGLRHARERPPRLRVLERGVLRRLLDGRCGPTQASAGGFCRHPRERMDDSKPNLQR